jgi:serine/threonine-protein kinase RsbW
MITVSFPGRFSSLDRIRNFYATAARQAGLEEKAVNDVELAVDEAASNIIQHAYGGEDKGDIECSYSIDSKGLMVVMRDFGKTFNPGIVKQPDLKSDVCCREEGGLGLHFMRSLMDSVEFSFNGHGGNLLTMTKRLRGKQEKNRISKGA